MNPLILKIGGPLLLAGLFIWWHSGQVGAMQDKIDAAKVAQEFAEDTLDEFRRADVAAKGKAVEDASRALQTAQDEFERQLAQERELRAVAERLAEDKALQAANSDRLLEELKRDDQEIRDWGATGIPGGWIDFMHGDLTDPTSGLSGARDTSSAGPPVAATAGRVERDSINSESG